MSPPQEDVAYPSFRHELFHQHDRREIPVVETDGIQHAALSHAGGGRLRRCEADGKGLLAQDRFPVACRMFHDLGVHTRAARDVDDVDV